MLYPAGYYASPIPVTATLSLPAGWTLALEHAGTDGAATRFQRVPLETLIDSPVFAGAYAKRIDLDPATGVRLNVFADRPDLLKASPSVRNARLPRRAALSAPGARSGRAGQARRHPGAAVATRCAGTAHRVGISLKEDDAAWVSA